MDCAEPGGGAWSRLPGDPVNATGRIEVASPGESTTGKLDWRSSVGAASKKPDAVLSIETGDCCIVLQQSCCVLP